MKDGLTGAPETYGIDETPNPGKSKGPEGMTEQNIEPPTKENQPSGIDNTTGEVTGGPKFG